VTSNTIDLIHFNHALVLLHGFLAVEAKAKLFLISQCHSRNGIEGGPTENGLAYPTKRQLKRPFAP
jgi:hypothetical protein